MPNWCENQVTFSGKDVPKLKEFMGTNEQVLSFQKVMPMPESLDIESGSSGSIGYEAKYGNFELVLSYPWVKEKDIKTQEELIEFLDKENPDYIIFADKYKFNLDNYGAYTWYEWRNQHWGTKWDINKEGIVIVDDTEDYLEMNLIRLGVHRREFSKQLKILLKKII